MSKPKTKTANSKVKTSARKTHLDVVREVLLEALPASDPQRARVWARDPIALARELGLSIAPLRDRTLSHRIVRDGAETWLLYRQEDHGHGYYDVGRKTGLNVFRGIVEFLGGDDDMLADLILPKAPMSGARDWIVATQVYAPEEYVRAAWDRRAAA